MIPIYLWTLYLAHLGVHHQKHLKYHYSDEEQKLFVSLFLAWINSDVTHQQWILISLVCNTLLIIMQPFCFDCCLWKWEYVNTLSRFTIILHLMVILCNIFSHWQWNVLKVDVYLLWRVDSLMQQFIFYHPNIQTQDCHHKTLYV